MIVVDASVAVKWFIQEPDRAAATRLINSGEILVSPDLVILEVLNVLRRKQRQKLISERQVIKAVGSIYDCFSDIMIASKIVDESLSLSFQLDHSIYDCTYLAWAINLDAKLVTADGIFVRKIARTTYVNHVIHLDQF